MTNIRTRKRFFARNCDREKFKKDFRDEIKSVLESDLESVLRTRDNLGKVYKKALAREDKTIRESAKVFEKLSGKCLDDKLNPDAVARCFMKMRSDCAKGTGEFMKVTKVKTITVSVHKGDRD